MVALFWQHSILKRNGQTYVVLLRICYDGFDLILFCKNERVIWDRYRSRLNMHRRTYLVTISQCNRKLVVAFCNKNHISNFEMTESISEELYELFSLNSKRFSMWLNEQNERQQLISSSSSLLGESSMLQRVSSLSAEQHEEYIRLLRKSQAAENVDDATDRTSSSSTTTTLTTTTAATSSSTVLTMSEVAKFGALEIAVRDEQRQYHAWKYAEILKNTQLHCYLDSRVELQLSVIYICIYTKCVYL